MMRILDSINNLIEKAGISVVEPCDKCDFEFDRHSLVRVVRSEGDIPAKYCVGCWNTNEVQAEWPEGTFVYIPYVEKNEND